MGFIFFLFLFPCKAFPLAVGPFVQISPTGNNGVPPLLAVANNGNSFAAWINFPNTIQASFFNVSTNTWTSFTLAQGANPQIGVDQDGNSFIVWVSPTGQILVSRFNTATLSFSTPTQLSSIGTQNSSPIIAVSSSGVALVVWLQMAPRQVFSRSFHPLTGWSAALPLAVLPSSIGLDATNRGFAIIDSFSGTPQGTIQVARIVAP